MRSLRACLRAACLTGALLPVPAGALTLSFEGSVTKLLDYPPMGVPVTLGDPVAGTFHIDPAAAFCAPGGFCGEYAFEIGGIGIQGRLEDAAVLDAPPGSEDRLLILDENPDVPGLGCSGDCLLVLEFRDAGGTALSSGDLEAALLALPSWPGAVKLLDVGNFTTFQEMQLTFTAIALVPDATSVPALPFPWLPGAALAVAAAGLRELRGRSSRFQSFGPGSEVRRISARH